MGTLQNEVARDFMISLLLTGMRFGETRKLKWSHVDFENKILTVPRELTVRATENLVLKMVIKSILHPVRHVSGSDRHESLTTGRLAG